ncbi:MAG: Asp-tRNA(Asn)/Glu-tRNA(Gln) amidotransferase GatCAB subunit C, partial [Patescibacteria group bacterium]
MIDKEKVKHLALLARLTLNDEEIEALTKDLNNILNYVEKINELNLEGLEPLYNLLEELPLREDKISESEN